MAKTSQYEWVSDVKTSVLLNMRWFSYVRVSLKQDGYLIYIAQIYFTIPVNTKFMMPTNALHNFFLNN